MKSIYLTTASLILACYYLSAQTLYPPYYREDMPLPDWVHEMMSENPNVFRAQSMYRAYYDAHPFEKNNFTQYYKKWMHYAQQRTGQDGFIHKNQSQLPAHSTVRGGSVWSSVGPFETLWEENQTPASWQVNVYCVDRSISNPDVLYCATEGAEIYKSIDHGTSWSCVSKNYNLPSGESIRIHPTNPEMVYYGGGDYIFKTTDGGISWSVVYTLNDFNCSAIVINSSNPNIVMACGAKGLIRSTDAGSNWTTIYTSRVWDLAVKPGDTNTIYCVKTNSVLNIAEFFKSTDGGATFNLFNSGWYSGGTQSQDGGARIGVTPANPEVVYVHLIGQSKDGDNGFIGIWKSTDSGNSWSLPHGQVGAPYSCGDANSSVNCPYPNITTIGAAGTYHQGFYNCDLAVSATDENKLLIGGCSLWRSNDGAATFLGVGGYSGQVERIHPDIQDMLVLGNEVWLCSDGGINLSTDFFATHQSKKNGITGSDYWGFDQGWNEDVMVGGRYHNGNAVLFEGYPQGVSIRLGGGEAATGYINPGNNRLAYFSDISNLEIPNTVDDAIHWQNNSALYPNESYWSAEFSSMVFDPRCYNIVWMGYKNRIYKSTDGGINYNVIGSFGSNENDWVTWIDISRKNPDVLYAVHTKYSNNTSQLYRSNNGGITWVSCTMPPGYSRITVMQCSLTNPDVLWMAYRQASNGQKMYKSMDGGITWTNLSSAVLNDQSIVAIMPQAGTNDGVYLATSSTVFYRNNDMNDWEPYNGGLPSQISTLKLKPFYRDGKIRLASYGKGIWEAPLFEPVVEPICDIIVDKMSAFCIGDTFYFDDYSTLLHDGAQWSWTFEGGIPATSNNRNPKVVFNGNGPHLVSLTVTDNNSNSATDTLSVFINPLTTVDIAEGFENGFPPGGWKAYSTPNGAPNWQLNTDVGGYGQSASCMSINNYYNDGQGSYDDIGVAVNLNNYLSAHLTFDVAYARYSDAYIDSLALLVSTDCGLTFTELYKKGSTALATAPDYSADVFVPDNSQWRTDTVQLQAFTGIDHVIIAFRNIANYGQPVYIDNVNLQGTLNAVSNSAVIEKGIKLFPSLLSRGETLYIELPDNSGDVMLIMYDVNGKVILSQQLDAITNQIALPAQISSGTYHIKLMGERFITQHKLVVGK